MATKTETVDATAFFKSCDLTELQRQLTELEGNLELLVREKQKEIDALKLLVRTVDLFQNGKPAKVVKPRKEKPAATTPRAPTIGDRAKVYLEASGPATIGAIGKGIQAEYQSVYAALNCDPRFHKNPNGTYSLA